MLASIVLALASTALLATAQTASDAKLLAYGLTFEYMQAAFYKQGLAKYSARDFQKAGFPIDIRRRITEIASQEAAHVALFRNGFKRSPADAPEPCVYAFPDTNVKSFLTTARVLEGLEVSAILGAVAGSGNSEYVTAAVSFIATESRHNAYVRKILKSDAFPGILDTPIDPLVALALASQFVVSCPADNNDGPDPTKFKSSPSTQLVTRGNIAAGSTIEVLLNANGGDQPVTDKLWVGFFSGQQTYFAEASKTVGNKFEAKIPDGIYGQTYAYLSNSSYRYDKAFVVAGPTILEVANDARDYSGF